MSDLEAERFLHEPMACSTLVVSTMAPRLLFHPMRTLALVQPVPKPLSLRLSIVRRLPANIWVVEEVVDSIVRE